MHPLPPSNCGRLPGLAIGRFSARTANAPSMNGPALPSTFWNISPTDDRAAVACQSEYGSSRCYRRNIPGARCDRQASVQTRSLSSVLASVLRAGLSQRTPARTRMSDPRIYRLIIAGRSSHWGLAHERTCAEGTCAWQETTGGSAYQTPAVHPVSVLVVRQRPGAAHVRTAGASLAHLPG